MDPFHRSFPRRHSLRLIARNAVLASHTFDALAAKPDEAGTIADIRRYHLALMAADGVTDSIRDRFADRVPRFCYLGYALGGHGILPLEGRKGLRWYPIDDVEADWRRDASTAARAFEETLRDVQKELGLTIRLPSPLPLP